MLLVETFFIESFFKNWALHPITVRFVIVILKAIVTVNCNSLFDPHYRTIGFVSGLKPNLKRKKSIA